MVIEVVPSFEQRYPAGQVKHPSSENRLSLLLKVPAGQGIGSDSSSKQ